MPSASPANLRQPNNPRALCGIRAHELEIRRRALYHCATVPLPNRFFFIQMLDSLQRFSLKPSVAISSPWIYCPSRNVLKGSLSMTQLKIVDQTRCLWNKNPWDLIPLKQPFIQSEIEYKWDLSRVNIDQILIGKVRLGNFETLKVTYNLDASPSQRRVLDNNQNEAAPVAWGCKQRCVRLLLLHVQALGLIAGNRNSGYCSCH